MVSYRVERKYFVNQPCLGVTSKLLYLGIVLGYTIIYVLVIKKGYLKCEDGETVSTTKVDGIAYTNSSLFNIPPLDNQYSDRVWDTADYVIPPEEVNAFFVMTNTIVTRRQVQDTCPEDSSLPGINCTSNGDCQAGDETKNGVMTGECKTSNPADANNAQKVCWVKAWCPVAKGKLPLQDNYLLQGASNFAVRVKNYILFPESKNKGRNFPYSAAPDYLKTCIYNQDKECPIFRLGDIVKKAGENFDEMAVLGGVIAMNIDYGKCSLQRCKNNICDNCKPKYSFHRLDNRFSKTARGWKFKYSDNYYIGVNHTTRARDMVWAYGIRVVIRSSGEGCKFDFITLCTSCASAFTLSFLAAIVCDLFASKCLKDSAKMRKKMKRDVEGNYSFKTRKTMYTDFCFSCKGMCNTFCSCLKDLWKTRRIWCTKCCGLCCYACGRIKGAISKLRFWCWNDCKPTTKALCASCCVCLKNCGWVVKILVYHIPYGCCDGCCDCCESEKFTLQRWQRENRLTTEIIVALTNEDLTTEENIKKIDKEDVEELTQTIGERILLQSAIDDLGACMRRHDNTRYPECLLNKFWHDNQLIEQIIPTLEKEKLTTKTVLKQMNGDDVKAVTTTIGQRILLQQIIDKLVEKDDIDHVETSKLDLTWTTKYGLCDETTDAIRNQDITTEDLLKDLNAQDLVELTKSTGERIRLRQAISEIGKRDPEVYALAGNISCICCRSGEYETI